jgi:hypothetical protein
MDAASQSRAQPIPLLIATCGCRGAPSRSGCSVAAVAQSHRRSPNGRYGGPGLQRLFRECCISSQPTNAAPVSTTNRFVRLPSRTTSAARLIASSAAARGRPEISDQFIEDRIADTRIFHDLRQDKRQRLHEIARGGGGGRGRRCPRIRTGKRPGCARIDGGRAHDGVGIRRHAHRADSVARPFDPIGHQIWRRKCKSRITCMRIRAPRPAETNPA